MAAPNLITFNALGLLIINNSGFAAELAVNADGGSLVNFDFDFSLFINTTGQDQTYTLPSDLTAIIIR